MATIDNDTFRELNGSAEIFPGKANYWVIVVRRPDLLKMGKAEQAEAAQQVVEDFARRNLIDADELRALDVWAADGVPKGKRYGLVQPQPMTYPEGSVFVSLTWDAVNENQKSIPWPWEYRGFSWQDVQEGLVSIHQPSSIVTVPDTVDSAVYTAEVTAGQIKDQVASLGTTALLWVAAGGAALYALGRVFR